LTTLSVAVAIDPERQFSDQLLGAEQGFGVIIEPQFMFDGGEKALYHCVVPAAALG
jgi:hypothetical protein